MLAPLRASPDGVHQITLALEPEGLGSVRATVTVGNDHVAVQLSADNADGREALRQSLPQLRQSLQGDSAASTTVTLSHGRGDSGANRNGTRANSDAVSPSEDEESRAAVLGPVVTPDGDGHLVDVRL
ncbi:MAG TPA: flagellar hook-length control protein FliK [Acidimicrobiales bacterium]|nr:flagellar hook-length control protein FliK [Acidimicrobiales bacterium]